MENCPYVQSIIIACIHAVIAYACIIYAGNQISLYETAEQGIQSKTVHEEHVGIAISFRSPGLLPPTFSRCDYR